MMQMRPVFQTNALFSDETRNYVEPMEPKPGETVTIRFRTGKNNVDEVYLINGEKRFPMTYEKTRGRFDFYMVQIVMDEEIFRYYFELHAGKIQCFYNKRGISKDVQEYYELCHCAGIFHSGLGKGCRDVPDFHRPVLQRRSFQ